MDGKGELGVERREPGRERRVRLGYLSKGSEFLVTPLLISRFQVLNFRFGEPCRVTVDWPHMLCTV